PIPTFQARAAWSFSFRERSVSIGVSGHVGREEYDIDATGDNEDAVTDSINIDVSVPLTDKISLKGEYYQGRNVDNYLGGIGQGLDAATVEEIESQGGWLAASFGPHRQWQFNLGYSADDPDNEHLAAGARSRNVTAFGNAFVTLNKSIRLGFEVSHWETNYIAEGEADSIRVQTSCIYSF
ncbi:hypothetical protein ACFL01_01170, partial [Planctomycetota bacterium]